MDTNSDNTVDAQDVIQGVVSSEAFADGGYLAVIITAVVVLLVTWIAAMVAVKLFRRVYNRATDDTAGSVFTIVIRVTVWGIGLSVLLKLCFNFDASFILGALGVGGIALSLGLQSTVSNLLGGIQISFTREIAIGDWVTIGTVSGEVKDINWRTTYLLDDLGKEHHIPNSVLNSSTVTRLPEHMRVPVSFVVSKDADLPALKTTLEGIADKALADKGFAYEGKGSSLAFKGSTAEGIQVTLVAFSHWDFSTPSVETCVLEPVLDYLTQHNLHGSLR